MSTMPHPTCRWPRVHQEMTLFPLQKKQCQVTEETPIKKLGCFALIRTLENKRVTKVSVEQGVAYVSEVIQLLKVTDLIVNRHTPSSSSSSMAPLFNSSLFLPSWNLWFTLWLCTCRNLCVPGWVVYKACAKNTNAANATCTQSIHLWEYSPTRDE